MNNKTSHSDWLRVRANWYREFAKLGAAGDRSFREALADHFEREAEKAEKGIVLGPDYVPLAAATVAPG